MIRDWHEVYGSSSAVSSKILPVGQEKCVLAHGPFEGYCPSMRLGIDVALVEGWILDFFIPDFFIDTRHRG